MSEYTLTVQENGDRIETWKHGNQLHRADGPALIIERRDGERIEEWRRFGKLHCEGKPAVKVTDVDGYRREEWYANGNRHRIGAPAEIVIRPDRPTKSTWWVGGKQVDPVSKPLDFNPPPPTYLLVPDAYGDLTLWRLPADSFQAWPVARKRDVSEEVWNLLVKGAGNPVEAPADRRTMTWLA